MISSDCLPIDLQYQWTSEREKGFISLNEPIEWLTCDTSNLSIDLPTTAQLESWMEYGPRQLRLSQTYSPDAEYFCDVKIVENLNRAKSSLNGLPDRRMNRGRSVSNPFESIGRGIFQNRAAMRMANIDASLKFMFTNFIDSTTNSPLGEDEVLYFADICGGPGGFAEYVLWRKSWHSHGFGFTLKSGSDWSFDEFIAGSTETFEVHYGEDGKEPGDIYIPENLISFRNFVLSQTDSHGVHFAMADGGFSVDGNENMQEILSKRLYLCQFLCALGILRTGGHFMCKLFDCFTPFTIGLIYLMYLSFDSIAIFKPNASRPANSEKFLICKGKKATTDAIENFLFSLNCHLDAIDRNDNTDDALNDIISIVPIENVIKVDSHFYNYIYRVNTLLGKRQILFLSKMKIFADDLSLKDLNYGQLISNCYEKWLIPHEKFYRDNLIMKLQEKSKSPWMYFKELYLKHPKPIISITNLYNEPRPKLLTHDNLNNLKYIHSYKVMIINSTDFISNTNSTVSTVNCNSKRGFILSMGKCKVYFWNGDSRSDFELLQFNINLPNDTLVYGEIVDELEGEGRAQRRTPAVHLIDALYLGGQDVRNETLDTRSLLLGKLIKSLQVTHPPKINMLSSINNQFTILRHRKLYNLTDLYIIFDKLHLRECKSGNQKIRLCYNVTDKKFITVSGLLILPIVKVNKFLRFKSSSSNKFYFLKKSNESTTYELPRDAKVTISDFYDNSYFWPWDTDGRNTSDNDCANDTKFTLGKSQILKFLQSHSS